MTGGREGPTELDFKGSGCDHEVLGVLEAKTSQTRPYLISKCLFLRGFWPLEPPKPNGRTQSSLAERSKALPGERLCTKIHKETVAESQLSSTRKKSRKICLQ